MSDTDIQYRPIQPEDDELLYRVYASTRELELAAVGWPEQQKESFLRMQHRAQQLDYTTNYPDARFDLILRAGEPIGRLYVHQRDNEVRIIDIAILPQHRTRGLGTQIIQSLQQQAADIRKPLTINVERTNPAKRLYDRLGFKTVGEGDVYLLMEWQSL